MATREEIRERIHWDTALARIILESNLLPSDTAYWQVVELVKDILRYQDSQGVVIKVDRDLVNTTRETETIKSELHKAIDAHINNRTTFIELMDGIVKAGYVAVEPLIKE